MIFQEHVRLTESNMGCLKSCRMLLWSQKCTFLKTVFVYLKLLTTFLLSGEIIFELILYDKI